MLKVMIAGDSFGMPRPFKMTNDIEMHYEDCYPEQLRKMLTAHYKTPNKEEDILLINYCTNGPIQPVGSFRTLRIRDSAKYIFANPMYWSSRSGTWIVLNGENTTMNLPLSRISGVKIRGSTNRTSSFLQQRL